MAANTMSMPVKKVTWVSSVILENRHSVRHRNLKNFWKELTLVNAIKHSGDSWGEKRSKSTGRRTWKRWIPTLVDDSEGLRVPGEELTATKTGIRSAACRWDWITASHGSSFTARVQLYSDEASKLCAGNFRCTRFKSQRTYSLMLIFFHFTYLGGSPVWSFDTHLFSAWWSNALARPSRRTL